MKRFRSSGDLDHFGNDKDKLSSHRPLYSPKSSEPLPTRGKSILSSSSSSSRFDRDPDPYRRFRKRYDHDLDRFISKKGLSGHSTDRYADRKGHGPDSIDRNGGHTNCRGLNHRSDDFSISKKEFPKGVRSDRDRSRREGNSSSSSWNRIGNVSKDLDEARGGKGGGFAVERERKVLKDVRSPTWSRDSSSDQSKRAFLDVSRKVRSKYKEKSPGSSSRGDSFSEQQSKMSSPVPISSDVKVEEKDDAKEKSPSWSSEQFRSLVVKKSAEGRVESGSSSEMEEGQLEPEGAGKPGSDSDVATDNGTEHGSMALDDPTELLPKRDGWMDVGNEAAEDSKSKEACMTDIVVESGEKEDEVIPNQLKKLVCGNSESMRDESETETDSVTDKHGSLSKGEVESSGIHFVRTEGTDADAFCGEVSPNEEAVGLDTPTGCKLPEEGAESQELYLGNLEDSRLLKHQSELSGERPMPVPVDRGKTVTFVPINVADAGDGSVWVGKDSRGVLTSRNLDEEGPSTQGFELFSRSPVRKLEQVDHSGVIDRKNDEMEMEPLDLSLSLPNVLLSIGARDVAAAPASPSQGRSMQSRSSFRANSEGFTASISCSGSQPFFHNPSCSLTQNSLDFEQSVKSRPLFLGVDWQALAQSESRQNEPAFQGTVSHGNGYLHHQSQTINGNSNGQLRHGVNHRVLEGISGTPNGLDRQLSLHLQVSDGMVKRHDDEGKSHSQGVGSHEMGAMPRFDRKQGTDSNLSGNLYRSCSQKAREQMLSGSEFVESVIEKIVSEHPSETARKFHEMQGEVLTHLKESVYEMMVSSDKSRHLLVFQEALQERPDITMEMLLKNHRSQLEIMVALKTGQADFLRQQTNLSTSDMAEIFLNLRCQNLACRSPLPVNECDCKVCVRKNGFCSECMCLLCFKFDMASNTCRWVGCDLCLHWCHVDCAIRESYIRNGPSASGTPDACEVQFYCVACGHPSEMFGFVKDVFQSFSKEWSAENFRWELEYVRRIFHCSKDLRGKWLYGVADQMLGRLADKANLPEVYNHVITLLKETDPSKFVDVSDVSMDSRKEKNTVAGPSQDASWVKAIIADKNSQGERVAIDIPSNTGVRNERVILDSEALRNDHEEPRFDELESIVRIKHAEAKMFQSRADDARREAEGLRRIAVVKHEKTEEEFRARIGKLRLTEAEEVRKQKSEELQALERSHREYLNMKTRMESDIKDLLSKMESTKRNIAL